jgi:hypothetical protein
MPSRTQSIFIGGLVVGLLSTSVLGLINLACCAGVIIGAMVGVWHYTEEYQLTIPSGQGALIGALAGILGAIIAGILNQILVAAGLDFAAGFRETLMQMSNMEMTPEQMEAMEQQAQQGNWFLMLAGTLFSMVLYAIFGAIGGAIGASVFQKGDDASEASSAPAQPTNGF